MDPGKFVPPHYRILGLDPDASEDDVRAAYRRLAKKHHPDANPDDPGSEELFKKVADAYRILSDPNSRARYNQAAGIDVERAESIKNSRPIVPVPGADILIKLHLSIEQAVSGGRKELKIPRKITCPACRGEGGFSGGGDCRSCQATGIVKKMTTVAIEYPPGVRTGSKLRYGGWGNRLPPLNSAGDLLIEILLKPHRYLEVRGSDLLYHVLIGLDLFIEGGALPIPLPSGRTEVQITPRITEGQVLRLAGKGLPQYDKLPAGDFLICFSHCLPKKLSRREREHIKELMTLPGFRPPVDVDGLIPKGD